MFSTVKCLICVIEELALGINQNRLFQFFLEPSKQHEEEVCEGKLEKLCLGKSKLRMRKLKRFSHLNP